MNLNEIIAESQWTSQPGKPKPDPDVLTQTDLSYEMPFDEFDKEKLKRIIGGYLDQLSPSERHVIRRTYWDNYSSVDLAKELRIPEIGAIHRIRKALRRIKLFANLDKVNPRDYSSSFEAEDVKWDGHQPRKPVPDLDAITPSDLSYEMPFDEFDKEKLKKLIASYIDRLPKFDRFIIRRLFWDDYSYTDLAKELNVTKAKAMRMSSKPLIQVRRWAWRDGVTPKDYTPEDYSEFKADESRGHDIIKQKLQDIESRKSSQDEKDAAYDAHIERMKKQKREYLKKNPNSIYKPDPETNEDKDPCWKGYKQLGTKKKSNKTVPNCVPVSESTSLDSTIKSITNHTTDIMQVFEALKSMAEKWFYNNGNLKGFHRNAAGIGKRWFDQFYFNRLQNELYDLTKYSPHHSAQLRQFLKMASDGGSISFIDISKYLPDILQDLGSKIKSPDLERFAANWSRWYDSYYDALNSIGSEEEDDYQPPSEPKPNIVGQQNAQVEKIVNDVLSSLPKNLAGEIRNAIAKSGNKLAALQQELGKRGISLSESKLVPLSEDVEIKMHSLISLLESK